jgi:hypothetical protein
MEDFNMEYEEFQKFLINELNTRFNRGELRPWCDQNGLSLTEICRFKSRKLPTTRPFFLQNILTALGYTDINIQHKTIFKFNKVQ